MTLDKNRALNQIRIVDNPAYRQCGSSRNVVGGLEYSHPRYIFDWSCSEDLLAKQCAWKAIGPPEEGLGCVYIIKPKVGDFCKVGISDSPDLRLATLQTAHWDDLSIYAGVWVWDNRARDLEYSCHVIAKEAGYEVKREWIRLSPADTLGLVIKNAAALNLEAAGSHGIWAARNEQIKHDAQSQRAERIAEAKIRAARQGY